MIDYSWRKKRLSAVRYRFLSSSTIENLVHTTAIDTKEPVFPLRQASRVIQSTSEFLSGWVWPLFLYMPMAARTTLLLCVLTSWAVAQAPIPTAHGGTGDEYPYLVSATYMHVHTDASFSRPLGLNGFAGSFSRAMWPSTRLTGEVGHYSKNGISVTSFLAGPQAGVRIWRIQPYLSILGGLSRINNVVSSNEFTIAAGGGLDVPWTNHIRIRALECDYYRLFGGNYPSADYLRIGVGIAYAFGE